MKIKQMVISSLAAGLLLVGAGGVAAQANNSVSYGSAVTTAHNSSSHVLSVYDAKSDGYGGRSLYSLSNGATGNLDNDKGFGTTTTKTITGSGTIKFNACTKNGATTINCSGNVTDAI